MATAQRLLGSENDENAFALTMPTPLRQKGIATPMRQGLASRDLNVVIPATPGAHGKGGMQTPARAPFTPKHSQSNFTPLRTTGPVSGMKKKGSGSSFTVFSETASQSRPSKTHSTKLPHPEAIAAAADYQLLNRNGLFEEAPADPLQIAGALHKTRWGLPSHTGPLPSETAHSDFPELQEFIACDYLDDDDDVDDPSLQIEMSTSSTMFMEGVNYDC